jgi:transcriptional regulator with XRE-family HTH domain
MKYYEKLREYRELSGLTKHDVKALGDYPNSEQYYGKVENGLAGDISDQSLKECYTAINIARCRKQGLNAKQEQDT